MNGWVIAALVCAGVVVVIVRRVRGEPLVAREVYGTPLILIVIGGSGLLKQNLTAVDVLWLVLGSAVGIGFGAVRARTTKLFERDGVLWQRYTGWTFAVWAVSLAANFGIGTLAVANGMHEQARPMPLSIGLSLLGEALMLAWRAKDTGVPYAPPSRRELSRR
ncbi:DUF1453 domain-containing protein [Amycolatopsis sp. NPDC059027]|uniref:DUF1453 domain-containing protein n=1 Tax=unclassified Amycolatopsis TaxID=2618356 RepID=UPI003672CA2C